jgi:CubicO group peptidase (beta-lactamase class C family)
MPTWQPVTPALCFEVGSIGKTFTAVLGHQLAAEGKLNLNTEVGALPPWFVVPSRFGPILVRHLLSHSAGIIITE